MKQRATAWYFVHVSGRYFDPGTVHWPETILLTASRAPGQVYTDIRGEEQAACDGFVSLRHRDPLREGDLLSDKDPLIRFLAEEQRTLAYRGVEEIIVFLGVFRSGQMNSELSNSQLTYLVRAGADLGISFYELENQ